MNEEYKTPDLPENVPVPEDQDMPEKKPAEGFWRSVFSGYADFVTYFIRKHLLWTAVVILFFTAGMLAGYEMSASDPEISQTIMEGMAEKLDGISSEDPGSLFVFLIINNASVAFASVILGIIPVIAPVFISFFNGFAVGAVVEMISEGRGIAFILAGLLPHGIFELSAVFLACAAGLRLGLSPVILLYEERFSFSAWKDELKEAVAAFILIILPMLLIAAFIEAFVTPSIMDMFA
ncbi:stage II sporulation protein M [Methanosarcinaceae archaeon]|nr:stage II sporulation protein M [Methanosarcinaceae archaeon]MBQ3621111.1 stage II sporulation protein M [Methanosarcinaceae archaeon]